MYNAIKIHLPRLMFVMAAAVIGLLAAVLFSAGILSVVAGMGKLSGILTSVVSMFKPSALIFAGLSLVCLSGVIISVIAARFHGIVLRLERRRDRLLFSREKMV